MTSDSPAAAPPVPTRSPRAVAVAVALALGAPLAGLAPGAHAAAFQSCPSEGFLTQGSVPRTYAVDLVTGDYSIAASAHGTDRSLNAVGFNPNDQFLYAYMDLSPFASTSLMNLQGTTAYVYPVSR